MISKEQVISLYRTILDRDPESDVVINEKRQSSSAADAAVEMLMSGEFIKKNAAVLKAMIAN